MFLVAARNQFCDSRPLPRSHLMHFVSGTGLGEDRPTSCPTVPLDTVQVEGAFMPNVGIPKVGFKGWGED